jgi:hypothetical protein
MSMFYFIFDARPTPKNPKHGTYGGASVSCWVQRDTQAEAEAVARRWITERHWAITAMEEATFITKETQLPAGMQFFEQAEIDDEVFVFHTSPVGAPDDTKVG